MIVTSGPIRDVKRSVGHQVVRVAVEGGGKAPVLVFPDANLDKAMDAVAVGIFMATLDGNIVNVALPTLGAELGVPIDRLEWIVSAYLLAISATLLAMGRLGDVLGHRAVFVTGMLGFTLGSALCGAAPGHAALSTGAPPSVTGSSKLRPIARKGSSATIR